MPNLSRSEKLDWLQLIRTENIGPITFHQLLERYKNAKAALIALPGRAQKAGRMKPLRIADRDSVEAEFDRAKKIGARLMAACEPDFPPPLKAIPDCPPILYVRGHHSLFEKPGIAIVGARNASGVGRKIARQLAADLGAEGLVIVSGLARGIDGEAHAAALDTGTIAVVAGGVDIIYPPEHDALTNQIAERGAVISERPPGERPTARDFPKRNRLISGLSRGVIVVEAAAKSGTLITARFALEQGREVFAVPGSPLDPRCQGANRLIRDGALLVERADDVLDALAVQNFGARESDQDDLFDGAEDITAGAAAADEHSMPEIRAAVLELLGYTPFHRDEILRAMAHPAGYVIAALVDLVLAGSVEEHSGGRFSRKTE